MSDIKVEITGKPTVDFDAAEAGSVLQGVSGALYVKCSQEGWQRLNDQARLHTPTTKPGGRLLKIVKVVAEEI